jgi:hypothetical protein
MGQYLLLLVGRAAQPQAADAEAACWPRQPGR